MLSLTSANVAQASLLFCGAVLAQSVAAADFEARPQGGIAGALLPEERALWSYNTESKAFDVVEGDASAPYAPNLRALPDGSKVGFAEGWAAIPFSYAINQRLYELADELGFEVVYCDNDFKADKAVSCAELIVQQGADVVIESNWQSGAAAAVMNIFNEAGIPVMSVDVVHPNAIFLGADNYVSGLIGGQAAAEHAKALGRCDDVSVLVGVNPGEGDAANERLSGFVDGVQTVCGALPEDRIDDELIDAGTTDQALTIVTDWLTAHPGAGFVLATAIDDPRGFGMSNALAQAGREGVAVGIGCDDIGVAATRTPVAENNFLGCVAYFPEKYPDYAVSVAADILEGQAVPQEVHLEHIFLDAESINDVYPAE
ncbi:sugar ABC transporter substrate-binding protein [Ruegeria hyattellae]|uniref:sugar ABC transporter substrate-binding protein n=1 Tax=Ruegeria hyattellae TaxID=3233337 RepID=UPI00355C3EDE